MKVILFLMAFCSLVLPVNLEAGEPLTVDHFEQGLVGWEGQSFKGETEYSVILDEGGGQVLFAESRASATGLIKRLEVDPKQYPRLRWRWKISSTLKAGDARTKEGDDYAARIYVIFPHWIKPLTRTINYIWANKLPQGDAVPNRYFSRAMMVAVESGDEKAGLWITEERDVLEDYRRLFGEEPPEIGGVAIMTDTDNTGEHARAWYDDLLFLPAD